MNNLVIVESPTKARTLSQFLGSEYQITASMGHVRDLPRGEFGVDVGNGFAPKYVIPKEKIKIVNNLAKVAGGASYLWLATDPDREGEAIAWNLLQVISYKSKVKSQHYSRVVFHEITKEAVKKAFEHPRKIDDNLVRAQQARRVLDRIVGYKLSPLLWRKVKSGLSAGRVQSAALRLVVDREREITAFKSQEYWLIEVCLLKELVSKKEDAEFVATLVKIGDQKAEVKNQKEAQSIVATLGGSQYQVVEVRIKDIQKSPPPPLTTSTLQQVAASKLGYSPKWTMRLAQDLYEQGLITYMRTDSVSLSPPALTATRKLVGREFGQKYLPSMPRRYKVKSRLAQEAHEAIRPTNIEATSDKLSQISGDHRKLYDLIWKRMVACQMTDAKISETQVAIQAKKNEACVYLLQAVGRQIQFDGWFKVYQKPPIKEQFLPELSQGESLVLIEVKPQQKFTEPPPRFTEATLIKELEKNGIGRPSTYAPTIATLHERNYIERTEDRKIAPTPIGKTTVDFLVKHFPEIVDLSFTAGLEDDLDKIAQGKQEVVPTMEEFWKPFAKQVEKVTNEVEKVKVEIEQTDEKCEQCARPMVVRYGKFGKFLACSGFPECKNTKAITQLTGLTCPQCGGNIVMKKTRRGKPFWGCENWPRCQFASWQKPKTANQDLNPARA